MDTRLIWTPCYYGQFALAPRKESPYIFSKFNLLNMDTFYGPLSAHINKVWLQFTHWRKFTPVLSCCSVFVYMIPPHLRLPWLLYQNENFTPVQTFATISCKQEPPLFLVWNRSAGGLKQEVHAWFSSIQDGVVMSVMGRGKNMQTCKCNAKSRGHIGMKPKPVHIFSCKQPLAALASSQVASHADVLGDLSRFPPSQTSMGRIP